MTQEAILIRNLAPYLSCYSSEVEEKFDHISFSPFIFKNTLSCATFSIKPTQNEIIKRKNQVVIVATGWNESFVKYLEVVGELVLAGFSF